MDKIKSILSPGHRADENTMYATGDNSGKVAGEGSHFGDTRSANVPSDAASTTAIKEGVSGSSTDASGANIGAIKAAQHAVGAPTTSESSSLPIYNEMTGKQDTSATSGLASSAAATALAADKSNRGPGHESVATMPAETIAQPSATPSNIGTAVTTGAAPSSSITSPETSAAAHTSSVETTPSAATQSSALPTNEPGHHDSRDIALGATVAAATGIDEHAASKFHESAAGESTTASNTATSGTTTTGTTTSGSSGPLGSLRDLINQKTNSESSGVAAAATGAGAGAGASAAHTSSTDATASGTGISSTGPSSTGPSSTGLSSTGVSSTGPSSTGAHIGSTSATDDSSSSGNTLRPLIDEKTNTAPAQDTTSPESHTTRDAALGAAAGAGLVGSYDYLKKDKDTPTETSIAPSSTTQPSTVQSSTTQPSTFQSSTTQPLSSTAEDSTQRDRLASLADTRAEGRIHSTDATAVGAGAAVGLGAAGLAEHEHAKAAEDSSMRERLGSLAEDRGEGKVKPSAEIPPTTTSGSGVEAYKADHEAETEHKERKGSILDVFKRHKDSEDETAKAGAVGATAGAAAGIAEHEHQKDHQDMTQGERLGSLSADRGEGKVQPSADIPPTTTSGSGIAAYEADKGAHPEHKERKGSILDIFKRHKNDDDKHDEHKHEKEAAAVSAGAVGAGVVGAHEYEKHHDASTTATTATTADMPQSVEEQKVYRDSLGRLRSDPNEKSAEPSAPMAGVVRNDLGQLTAADTTADTTGTTASAADIPQSVEEQKVYRDSFGRLQSDPTQKSAEPSAPIAGVVRNDLGQLTSADPTDNANTTGTEHRGVEAAAVGAGVGAVGAHEHNKHEKHAHHFLHYHDADRHSYASHPDHDKTHPAHDHPAAASRLGEGESSSHHHHKEEAVAVGAAGGVGAAALAHEHDKKTAETAGNLGESRGFFSEGYVHEKTPEDIQAEKRNSIAGLGLVHREGRFHGKEGGAPGAVGVPPSERDQAYIESQKHLPILHGAKAEQTAREQSAHEGLFNDESSTAGIDQIRKDSLAGRSTAAESGLLHGHHSESLRDTPDTNVEHPKHDPAHMGYDGKTHLNLG